MAETIDGSGVRCSDCGCTKPLEMFLREGSSKAYKRCKVCRTRRRLWEESRRIRAICRSCGSSTEVDRTTGRYKCLCACCSSRRAEAKRKMRVKKKSKGLCVWAPGCRNKSLPGHSMCAEHGSRMLKFGRTYKLKLRGERRCFNCRTPLPDAWSKLMCSECGEAHNQYNQVSKVNRAMNALLSIKPIEVPR